MPLLIGFGFALYSAIYAPLCLLYLSIVPGESVRLHKVGVLLAGGWIGFLVFLIIFGLMATITDMESDSVLKDALFRIVYLGFPLGSLSALMVGKRIFGSKLPYVFYMGLGSGLILLVGFLSMILGVLQKFPAYTKEIGVLEYLGVALLGGLIAALLGLVPLHRLCRGLLKSCPKYL